MNGKTFLITRAFACTVLLAPIVCGVRSTRGAQMGPDGTVEIFDQFGNKLVGPSPILRWNSTVPRVLNSSSKSSNSCSFQVSTPRLTARSGGDMEKTSFISNCGMNQPHLSQALFSHPSQNGEIHRKASRVTLLNTCC
jgi:hypothetical protein